MEFEIVVRFDVVSGVVSLTGCDKNPLVALGMLDYALARVRRLIATNDIIQDARNSPLISLPSRGPA